MPTLAQKNQLLQQIKKVRELQKRFWTSRAQNDLQQEYKRKLMIECKRQEAILDKLLTDIDAIQQFLAL